MHERDKIYIDGAWVPSTGKGTIDVINSTGDQLSLFNESLPGDKIRLNAYAQRQPLRTIAGGMPTATVEVWTDDLGRPLGHHPHLVAPERFVARVQEFAATCRGSAR